MSVLTVVGVPEALTFDASPPVSGMYLLSPYVWQESANRWRVAVRAVPHSDVPAEKIARIHLGTSIDGAHFELDNKPALSPGPGGDDRDGCEDPTTVLDRGYRVFYSGWNELEKRGRLLSATSDADRRVLVKHGRVLADAQGYVNAKEASPMQAVDGSWRLLFEHAVKDRSAIAMVAADTLAGPWTPLDAPFTTRPERWDSTHLSPGPVVVTTEGKRVLFYNGADDKARWRIGWAELDERCTGVAARCDEPLVEPPPVHGEDTDIAFASSAVQTGNITWLYYTVSDKDTYRVPIALDGMMSE